MEALLQQRETACDAPAVPYDEDELWPRYQRTRDSSIRDELIRRYAPQDKPESLARDIEVALAT